MRKKKTKVKKRKVESRWKKDQRKKRGEIDRAEEREIYTLYI